MNILKTVEPLDTVLVEELITDFSDIFSSPAPGVVEVRNGRVYDLLSWVEVYEEEDGSSVLHVDGKDYALVEA